MSFAAAATGSAAAPRHGLPHAKESVRRVHSDISETDEVERLPSLQIRDRRREMMMNASNQVQALHVKVLDLESQVTDGFDQIKEDMDDTNARFDRLEEMLRAALKADS